MNIYKVVMVAYRCKNNYRVVMVTLITGNLRIMAPTLNKIRKVSRVA